MSTIFIFCVIIGGTIMACQFLMTLFGLGHEGFDFDAGHVPSDSLGGNVHDPSHADVDQAMHGAHGSSWLFEVISFRTVVAAMTMFGLTGMTAASSGASLSHQLLIAVVSGAAAMFAVHGLMRGLYQLGNSGTLRLANAIGKTATVSISIPGNHVGRGKVRLTVQGRLEELAAVNPMQETLVSGSQVVVVNVVGGNILEVAPFAEEQLNVSTHSGSSSV